MQRTIVNNKHKSRGEEDKTNHCQTDQQLLDLFVHDENVIKLILKFLSI